MLSLGHDHWFIRKVVFWRAAASIAWSVLLLPASTAIFVLLSRVSVLHPIEWITGSLNFLCGSYVIFSIVLLCLVVLIIGFFILEFYTVVASIPCTQIALIGKVLHPQQSIHSLVHSMMGMLVSWCAAVMIGGRYQFLTTPCIAEESATAISMCLNEYHLFFLLAGAFMGYSYSLLNVVGNMNYVSFPNIQQCKYLRFKGTLPLVIKHSAVQAFYSVRNYCITYFFLGYIPRAWICTTMSLRKDRTLHSLDTLTGLLDFSLLYHLWISGTFLLVTWYMTWLLFRIYTTEVYCFPVQSSFSEDAHQCLPKVLSSKQPLILKYLALQDFALLSQNSPSRRQEVFSLSQPGGHPHNWSALSGECLTILNDLTQKLIAYQEAVSSNGRIKPQSVGSDKRPSSSGSSATSLIEEPTSWQTQTPRVTLGPKTPGSVFLRSSVASPFTPDLGSPFGSPAMKRLTGTLDPSSPWHGSVQSPHVMRRGPKLWTSSLGAESPLNGSPPSGPPLAPSPGAGEQKPSIVSLWIQNRQEQLPEASSQALFAESQAHIWALEGLSHLVAASYTEDRFGVVQTTLPDILGTMLTLQEAVDKHFKLPHASSKPARTSGSLVDTSYKTLRFALRTSLKTAIYRITTTFGEHLNAVQVSTDHRKRLQQFLEYKE
ncbi:nucleoporin NDC1-like isoform X2 [Polyodon spathula]|uniref:nucleoporin NDC1-like isoform X2 n=1 Tax=Polyodon spathula TaxID=7913 RepID=UPI001B7DC0C5|nr:nucleoporin NDC1-like isoform X2 [Polyodon spathula]